MEVELFLHGVPKGQDFWGDNNDQSYFANFYSGNKNNEMSFIIETHKFNNKNYCYYNYIKSKDIVDVDGRAGSYFGFSLRFDVYCLDIVNLYRLFDIVYNRYFVGNLLSQESTKGRFLVGSFSEITNEITKIESSFLQLIQLSFSGKDFIPIDDSFINKVVGVPECNIADCTKENIASALRKYSKVVISPYYPTNNEINLQKKCDEQLKAITISKDEEISKFANEFSQANNSLNALKNQINEQNAIIKAREIEIANKDKELKQFAVKRSISEIIEQIKIPLMNLSNAVGFQAPGTDERKDNRHLYGNRDKKNLLNFIPLVNVVLLVIVIMLLLWGFRKGDNSPYADKIIKLESEIGFIKQEKLQLEKKFLDYKKQSEVNNPVAENESNQKIDITPYTSGSLKMTKEYSISIKNFAGDGEWKADGFNIKDKYKRVTTIKPNRKGTVTISFYQGNNRIDMQQFNVE